MELKKYFTFSGVFEKLHEEDTQPIEILNANIYCHTNGNVLLEIASKENQKINFKRFYESVPVYESESTVSDRIEEFLFSQNYQPGGEIIQKPYEGDYKIRGETAEGWTVEAIVADANFRVEFGSYENSNNEDKCRIALRNILINYNPESFDERKIEEINYGLINIEVLHKFSTKINESEIEIYFEPVITTGDKGEKGVLSTEMKLVNIHGNEQDYYDTYSAWLTSLLSFALGYCVSKIYEIRTMKYEKSQLFEEYWPGINLPSEARGIAIIQSHCLDLFIQQCSKKIKSEFFVDKAVGLALSWYIDTFYSSQVEVIFLILCTALESLNKKYSKRANKRLLPKQIYKVIRDIVLKAVSDYEKGIHEPSDLEKYKVFKLKIEKSFAIGTYNQIGDLRTSLKEMFDAYNVPYKDLYPELEFIKVRDSIVHEGFAGIDINLELYKLSNLVIRVFLAILEYQGDYMEYIRIDLQNESGLKKYGLICRSFPFTFSKENTA
jgi:hypothetical protein